MQNFLKNLIYRTLLDDCSCWLLRSNQGFIHWSHIFHFFHHFFLLLLIIAIIRVFFQRGYKNEDFLLFTTISPQLTWMLLRHFHLSNNLLMNIRENLNLPRKIPQQLASAKASFECCCCTKIMVDLINSISEMRGHTFMHSTKLTNSVSHHMQHWK